MSETMGHPTSHQIVVGDFDKHPYQCKYKIEQKKIEVWSEEAREFNLDMCMSETDLKKFHVALCYAYEQGKADGLESMHNSIFAELNKDEHAVLKGTEDIPF